MCIGIFLKLHIMEKTVRRYVVPMHSVLGKLFPIVGWTRKLHSSEYHPSRSVMGENADHAEMLMGVATAMNFCRDGELGQCLAHYVMGSAFIAYAVILVIMLNFGGKWLERRGCSQEMLDSSVIMVWVSDLPESDITCTCGWADGSGDCQHIHGASRWSMDTQGHAAYYASESDRPRRVAKHV